jgi:DmsE family decaheme c-type cytochrome
MQQSVKDPGETGDGLSRLLQRILVCAALAMASSVAGLSAAAADFVEGGSERCLGCHDFGPDSPVHPLLESPHGNTQDPGAPMAEQGCEACHGPSAAHARAPTQAPPAVSFGPRWSASSSEQNGQCLACHQGAAFEHWDSAPHQRRNLSCVTCHDIHDLPDAVLQADTQAEVCTTCHKVQREGIHGIAKRRDTNPPCSTCHSPHDAQPVVATALATRSEGCRYCHNLEKMASSRRVSDKAKSYHKVMVREDRSCLDCHQGVAHAAADAVPPMTPAAAGSKDVSLFYPGQSDSEWLLTAHPGSQPLRQGASCQQCHRGDEAKMGADLAGDFEPSVREIEVSVARESQALRVQLSWLGPPDDTDIALLWGDSATPTIQRAGCFAACHSDMPGMSRDRGQDNDKYLLASRAQQRAIGRPALLKDEAELKALRDAGHFGELWRVTLDAGGQARVERAALLSQPDWIATDTEADGLSGEASYRDGRWEVTLRRPFDGGPGGKDLSENETYTFGVALHGSDNPHGGHWVSLPMTLGFKGADTDFLAE